MHHHQGKEQSFSKPCTQTVKHVFGAPERFKASKACKYTPQNKSSVKYN